MTIRLIYGGKLKEFDIPDGITLDEFAPERTSAAMDRNRFLEICREAELNRLFDGKPPLIVVNDAHRSTPTPQILTWLAHDYPSVLESAEFLVACGSHPGPGDDELTKIFGEHLEKVRDRITIHQAREIDTLAPVGEDRFGETVYLNRKVVDADMVLTINSVEPHYFAGYTGGRKSLFPGVTDFASIERSHNLANSLEAAPLRVDGNPMAECLDHFLSLIDTSKIFSMQVVYDVTQAINGIFVGTIDQSFRDGITLARELYAKTVKHDYDVVLAEVHPPLDRSLYQAQKALENTQRVVRNGGAAIVVSQCTDGIGSPHFYNLAQTWDRDTNKPKDGKLTFGSHKLSRVNAMTRRIDVRLLSDLDDDIPRRVFYEPLHDLEAYLKEKQERNDEPLTVALVHDAGHTVLTNA